MKLNSNFSGEWKLETSLIRRNWQNWPYTNPKTRNRRPDLSLLALHLNYNLVANDESSMESDFGPTESNRKLGSCKGKIDPNFRRSQKVKTKNKSSCEMATGIFMWRSRPWSWRVTSPNSEQKAANFLGEIAWHEYFSFLKDFSWLGVQNATR